MKKVIEKKIALSSNVRGIEKLNHELYSHDKDIAEFKFSMEGLSATKVICLFYFKATKRYKEVEAIIEDNSFTVKFDNSLIIATETVTGYIYFEKVEQSADVYAFSFNVKVSEIDKSKQAPVMEQQTKRIVEVNNIVTKDELAEAIAQNMPQTQGGAYDDSELRAELSKKANNDDLTQLRGDIEGLKVKADNDTVYNDEPLRERVTALENKPGIDTSNLVTKQELESKGYLTQHQSLSDYATKQEISQPYNDTELKKRVEQLENKPAVDTLSFVTNEALAGKGYLTEHQSLEGYAKKSEIPQPYNDTEVKQRLSTIEEQGKGYATKEQLASIPKTPQTPQTLSLNGNTLTLSDGGGSINLPQNAPANTSGQVSEYEIHGVGMPNGKVSAPVGTTYIDTAGTNKAIKWIKRLGDDSQGWVVLSGDTGWINLPIVSKLGASYLKIRRINNMVTYQFGGLSWGWFGIVRRGGPGYMIQPSDKDRNCYILPLGQVPQGFRPEFSLIGGIYSDKGEPYGTWYLGGTSDGNMLRFQFADPVPTNKDIGDIRVSTISYVTEEPWPTRLP
nr:MAG TPA: hypothetical protein [Caudoviricetes sp.]